jgi:predicted MFS family arabinose efflux permease
VPIAITVVLGLGLLALYALWERFSRNPMTPPWLLGNRPFVVLNVATVLVYTGLAVMFFLLPFDLMDRRHLTPTGAGLTFLPFTLGVGLLSQPLGTLADRIGARTMLSVGPFGAALSLVLLALGEGSSLLLGVLFPMTLLGVSFALLITPLTASVLSSVSDSDEGLASGVNNAVSRVAQLVGIALGAGLASYAAGYVASLIVAAILAAAAGVVIAIMLPRSAKKHSQA